MPRKMRQIKAWQRQWAPHPIPESGITVLRWRVSRQQERRRRVQSRRGYGTANGQIWRRRSGRRWHGDLPPLATNGAAYHRRTRSRRGNG